MGQHFKLVSFNLCPFVQRSVITMNEKGVPFDIEYIDLAAKPDWFLKISPLGKVPVLVVDDDTVLFESAVINEYLDEVTEGRLLPEQALPRAKGRAWIEVASNVIGDIYRLYTSMTEEDAQKYFAAMRDKLGKVEGQLPDDGPYFYGPTPSLVDFAFAPALMRADWIARLEPSLDFYEGLPKTKRWRDALMARETVQKSTIEGIEDIFVESVKRKERWIARNA